MENQSYSSYSIYCGVSGQKTPLVINSIPSNMYLNILKHVYFKNLFRFSPMTSSSLWEKSPFGPCAENLQWWWVSPVCFVIFMSERVYRREYFT